MPLPSHACDASTSLSPHMPAMPLLPPPVLAFPGWLIPDAYQLVISLTLGIARVTYWNLLGRSEYTLRVNHGNRHCKSSCTKHHLIGSLRAVKVTANTRESTSTSFVPASSLQCLVCQHREVQLCWKAGAFRYKKKHSQSEKSFWAYKMDYNKARVKSKEGCEKYTHHQLVKPMSNSNDEFEVLQRILTQQLGLAHVIWTSCSMQPTSYELNARLCAWDDRYIMRAESQSPLHRIWHCWPTRISIHVSS